MDRAKFQVTAPADETKGMEAENPRTEFKKKSARAHGRSGKGKVKSGKRSTFRKHYGR